MMKKKFLSIAAAGLAATAVVALAPAAQAAETTSTTVTHQVSARIVDGTVKVLPGSSYEFSIVVRNDGAQAETVAVKQAFLQSDRATVVDAGGLTATATGATGTVVVPAGETVTIPVEAKVGSTLGNLNNSVTVQSTAGGSSWLAWDANVITAG